LGFDAQKTTLTELAVLIARISRAPTNAEEISLLDITAVEKSIISLVKL
jgi:hypothetical protein